MPSAPLTDSPEKPVIHVAKSASSRQAKLALEKAVSVFGRDIAVLNDNGSENLGQSYQYLEQKRHHPILCPATPTQRQTLRRKVHRQLPTRMS